MVGLDLIEGIHFHDLGVSHVATGRLGNTISAWSHVAIELVLSLCQVKYSTH